MSCARNLVESCERNDFQYLFEGTKQIFGLCAQHGVTDPMELFRTYCNLIRSCLGQLKRDTVVEILHTLVWEDDQTTLIRLIGYEKCKWKSMLTVVAPEMGPRTKLNTNVVYNQNSTFMRCI